MSRRVYNELKSILTESTLPDSEKLDQLSIRQILNLINTEDQKIASAVRKVIPQIERAVEIVTDVFKSGGRLFYVGAGTSGRLGVLDASECPPTFGAKPSMVQGIIAGGRRTLVRSREGIEDDVQAAVVDVHKRGVGRGDVIIGIAASWRTPYTLTAVKEARKHGARSVYICCTPVSKMPFKVDVLINPITGPEVVTGSTRMKAGTATKLVINMITTTAMIKIGKTYGNRMVDLQARSEKLRERSKRILIEITGVSYGQAEKYIEQARGSVKVALVMILKNVSYSKARRLLKDADGFVYRALNK